MLAGKRGEPMEFDSPEKYPALKDKYTNALNYQGNVVQSCIHCHQIGDAQRQFYRDAGKPIPEKILFPYPHPEKRGPDSRSRRNGHGEKSHARVPRPRRRDSKQVMRSKP